MVQYNTVQELLRHKETRSRDKNEKVLIVSSATCGRANGSAALVDAFKAAWDKNNLHGEAHLRVTGCLGYCDREPLVIVRPHGFFYPQPKPADAERIVLESLIDGKPIERLFMKTNGNGNGNSHLIRTEDEVPFYKHQVRWLFGDNFEIDPTSLEDYIHNGGYRAVIKTLTEMQPEQIIEEITKSGLRGRGGAGFPTGVKWASCRKADGDTKYVVCNADEGDPGAYANRGLMEGNPHSIIEGMIIGAYGIGANQGFIYVRTEYPLAVELLSKAIGDCRAAGLLGKNILGTGFDFDIKINRGGGAFVCGESTALMASIEGRAGEPRAKHIHTVERGLWDSPTTLNNVETWSTVPKIINNGAEWFSSVGTGDVSENPWGGSKGTKIFSLVGKINNTGLVEVPMGITLRKVIWDIGDGIMEGKKFKGVQTGGPSGGVLSEKHLDIPIDYDRLVEVGSMMGSGGMIVMDEDTCMVDFARYFVNFLKDESCGKCTPCREGLIHMSQILQKICDGEAGPDDLVLLHDLAEVTRVASLCELGKTAPNPVLTTMEYYEDEYKAHVEQHRCPAGVCKALVTYEIDREKCNGCTLCAVNCPAEAISGESKKPHVLDQSKCTKCGVCYDVCKFDAVIRQ
jgi:NADH:ubiquinone oxidoreductase subunit F (NADH-binding)/(2Fe-2S) ferredoxin